MRHFSYRARSLRIFYVFFMITILFSAPAFSGFKEDLLKAKDDILNAGSGARSRVMPRNNAQPTTPQNTYIQNGSSQKQIVTTIQRDLTKLGYKPGPIDGDFGKGTQRALQQFQLDFGHKVTGVPDNAALAQISQAKGLSSPEQKLRQQTSSYSIVTDSMVTGCSIAAGGSMLVDIFSGDKDDIFSKKTLTMCGIGAGVGLVAGVIVRDRVKAHKEEGESLDGLIGDARQENADMSRSIRTANEVIAADRAKIDSIKKKLDSGQITKKEANAQLASVDSNTDYLNKTIKGMKKSSNEWGKLEKEVRKDDPQKAAEINAERVALNKKISSLESTVKDLVQLRKVTVG